MARRKFLAFLLAGVSAWSSARAHAEVVSPRDTLRGRAAGILAGALRQAQEPNVNPVKQRELLFAAINQVAEMLGQDSRAAQRLKAALAEADRETMHSEQAVANGLRPAVEEVRQDLAFRPVIEARLPRDFPEPTPVGEIEVKRYPAYRKAEVPGTGNAGFWTLFAHIKDREIAMTAPVDMGYGAERTPPSERSMAFLYGDAAEGELGDDGTVRVVDVPEATAVSIGVRGPKVPETVLEARKRLDAWLDAHQGEWGAAGPMRVMAYNSPFIPREKNYFEVQIPVEKE